jgi:holo-[acyl-carrier protein] synthase
MRWVDKDDSKNYDYLTNMAGIGVDIADIQRFRNAVKSGKNRFIANTFSVHEQDYCSSYHDAAPHYAGTFAAKEAVRKISTKFLLPFSEIEIRRDKKGRPEVWIRGRRARALQLSITHGTRDAVAVALQK